MIPLNTIYPEFVADQLLTSENLNQLFGYLDEQGRMTRTNLIGIGIVCGLQVQTAKDGTTLTITKGTGVTSQGYLVALDTIKYTDYIAFDAVKNIYYDKFVNVAEKAKKFDLWELKQAGVTEGTTKLSEKFLDDKVVLIFVELLEEDNKNCNPSSCDDKGINVTVNLKPLLVLKEDVKKFGLLGMSGNSITQNTFTALADIKMRRFDVLNTSPVTTQDIIEAYQSAINKSFIKNTEMVLRNAYSVFAPFVAEEFPNDPFNGLTNDFDFLHDGKMSVNQALHIQYYYDLFADLIAAYDEFKKTGTGILSACCPDSSLFPRHLLLGDAISSDDLLSGHRNYFIYSPLFEKKNLLDQLRSLFKKMVLLINQFSLPAVTGGGKLLTNQKSDTFIRITPSKLADVTLSEKAIPYYYDVNDAAAPLFKYWNFDKTVLGAANKNLSYHANQYNSVDDHILNPLQYDLEPYNFLRIEGHIGKQYVKVLQNIKSTITKSRLPIDVIALSTNLNKLTPAAFLANTADTRDIKDLSAMLCHFQDIETLYDTLKTETICTLAKELRYYYDIKVAVNKTRSVITGANLIGQSSKVPILNSDGIAYKLKAGTFGLLLETVYREVGIKEELTVQSMLDALNLDDLFGDDANDDGTPDRVSASTLSLLNNILHLFETPLYIIRLAQSFTNDLVDFDEKEYCRLHKSLSDKANGIKLLFGILSFAQKDSITTKADLVKAQAATLQLAKEDTKATAVDTTKTRLAAGAAAAGASATKDAAASKLDDISAAVNINIAQSEIFSVLVTSSQNVLLNLLKVVLLSEDFQEHLDKLIYSCKCAAFTSLKKEYFNRYAYLSLLRQFGFYTRMHPGIQHKAGVPMGGTFIIVYHKETEREATITASGLSSATLTSSATLVTVATNKRFKKAADTFTEATKAKEIKETKEISFVSQGTKDLAQMTKAELAEQIEQINTLLTSNVRNDNSLDDLVDDIPEGIVIADFYLPYLVSSECPPIQYIVPEIKEDPLKVTLDLEPNKSTNTLAYCSDDKGPYKFSTSPESGKLEPLTGVTLGADGQFVFTPSAVTIGDQDKIVLTFNYSKEGVTSTPIIVTVYHKPVAAFSLGPVTSPKMILLKNESKFANQYLWDFGDGNSSSEINPSHIYKTSGDFVVKLTATNTIVNCVSVITNTITIKDPVQTTLALATNKITNTNEYCANDSSIYLFTANPSGGEIQPNDGEIVLTNGKLSFDPSKVNVGDNVKVEKTYTYAKDGVTSAVVKATVYHQPVTAFTINQASTAPGAVVCVNLSKHADKFNWEFGDGTGSDLKNPPVHTYTKEGTYIIKLTSNNVISNCADSLAQTVVIKLPAQKTCSPLSDIIGLFDKTSTIQPQRFKAFKDVFKSYIEVESLFKKLNDILNDSTGKQIDFFATNDIVGLLKKWFSELFSLFLQNTDLRTTALFLYRVLYNLTMYIACIQAADMNTAKIQLSPIFILINKQIQTLGRAAASFAPEDKAQLAAIRKNAQDELIRITANGEDQIKVQLVASLKQMIQLITQILGA